MLIYYIGLGLLSIVCIWSLLRIKRLENRLKTALGGATDVSIEKSLVTYFKKIRSLELSHKDLMEMYQRVCDMAELASQKVSIVRFNPFGDTGGDQSFSLAVLDAHNSGYVLTSIHGREGTRVYVKPIDFGKSKYALSDEEQKALNGATVRVPLSNKAKD